MLEIEVSLENFRATVPKNLAAKRKKMFFWLLLSLILFFSSCLVYWFIYASRYVSTNNAYVDAEVAEVTALTDGVVEHICVIDTQHVKQGETLALLKDQDAKVALSQAEAKFLKAKADIEHAELNYKRRKLLAVSKSTSLEELGSNEHQVKVAYASFQEATAIKEAAQLNYERTKICSPIDGVIVQREIQLGQKVMSGNKLLSIVPLANVYVNANFKENELQHIKVGHEVILTSDKYGSNIKFHGTVQGFYGGTGSVFAIIPAQNATGNWVKVVQRLPVRIALRPDELIKNPLELGLSMNVKIDISN